MPSNALFADEALVKLPPPRELACPRETHRHRTTLEVSQSQRLTFVPKVGEVFVQIEVCVLFISSAGDPGGIQVFPVDDIGYGEIRVAGVATLQLFDHKLVKTADDRLVYNRLQVIYPTKTVFITIVLESSEKLPQKSAGAAGSNGRLTTRLSEPDRVLANS